MVMTAISTSAMVGAAGLGVDTVQWYLWNRQLQQAVDSGAMSAALNYRQGAAFKDIAESEVDRNYPDAHTVESVVNPPASGDWKGNTNAVEVIASASRSLPFTGMFMQSPPTIRVRSVAAIVAGAKHCVVALAEDGVGVDIQGNADLTLGCGAAANSRGASAFSLGGTSYLSANPISSVGGIVYAADNIDEGTTLLPYTQSIDDPLASRNLDVPTSPAGCTANNFSVKPQDTVVMLPGRYCKGVSIKGTATLSPGIYIMDGGDFNVSSQANVFGAGVTIVLTGNNTQQMAGLKINAGAKLELSATTALQDPDWAGVLFYQDTLGADHESVVNGDSDMKMNGIIYLPNGSIRFNGSSGQHADCLLLVAQRINFAGTSSLDNVCDSWIDDIDTSGYLVRVVE